MDDSNNSKPTPTTRKQGRHLRVPVLPEEEAAIKANAAQAGWSARHSRPRPAKPTQLPTTRQQRA